MAFRGVRGAREVSAETNHDSAQNDGDRGGQLGREARPMHQGPRRTPLPLRPPGRWVVVAIKDAIPGAGVKKGDVAKAVVVRAVSEGRRKDGRTSASTNAVVLINDDELPAHAHLRSVVASRA